jgi:L-threonylcarbamoyladenylate synthase
MKITTQIDQAIAWLRRGGLVAFPTETVYGLGADASNPEAVGKIFAAKERPATHPLIVHLGNAQMIGMWAEEIPEIAWKLAERCWPGPLTMILHKRAHVLDAVTGGQSKVGLRVPAHPVAQALLQGFGGGLAAPSANKFTHISPTTAHAVFDELGDRVDCILEGGSCAVGLESTILDLTTPVPRLLRPGMLGVAELSEMMGVAIDLPLEVTTRVPGMHDVHYAPTTPAELWAAGELEARVTQLLLAKTSFAVMVYSETALPVDCRAMVRIMSRRADVYAHDLYHTLRTLDAQGYERILIEDVPAMAEWMAIRDRLNKACARR